MNPPAPDAFDPFADRRHWWRLAATLSAGLAIALFLTWFMYILIEFSEQKPEEGTRAQFLDFVRLQREETSQRKDRRAERPEPSKAPPAPSTPDFSGADADLGAIAVSQIAVDTGVSVDVGGFGVGIGEGEFLPIVKVAPIYPPSLANRGIEGTCLVVYTVTTSGSTRDIRVVENECSHNGFRRPSVEAAAKFKYKPRVVGGEAVEVENVFNLFTYTLAEQ